MLKVPLEWLREYVAIRLQPEPLAERLTMAGLEVAGVTGSEAGPVLEIEVTPNRADCLSIIGVAREVAAITGQRLAVPSARGSGLRVRGNTRQPKVLSPERRAQLAVRIEDPEGCQRYIGRLIEGVQVAPSPDWMQRRLLACGARPVNNVVDVTNYVLLEHGQPLHAFDYDRLEDGMIVARRARAGERLAMLDGASRDLSPEMLVIADAKRPVAVAGVMGGLGSEVVQQTKAILLESALFDPVSVRRTARKLGLASEASYRFERGVDPGGVERASWRAAQLIRQMAGGRETTLREAGGAATGRRTILLDMGAAQRRLGFRMAPMAIRTTLARLSCRVISTRREELVRVEPPSFRRDLRQEADLCEEIARLAGYDRLPATVPMVAVVSPQAAEDSADYWRAQSLKCFCASLGLTEVISWALVSEADLVRCGGSVAEATRIANPLSRDHEYVRPSLLSGLLHAARRNLTQDAAGVALFEVGAVAHRGAEGTRLGIALSGLWAFDWRAAEPCDFFRLKGLLEALVGRLCEGSLGIAEAALPWAEPHRGVKVTVGGRTIGEAGEVSGAVTSALDLGREAWFAELDIREMLSVKRAAKAVKAPSAFPPVKRDVSVVVRDGTPFEAMLEVIREGTRGLSSRIELTDRYTGAPVAPGSSSLTFSIEYRDDRRTLTAAEVDVIHQRVGQSLVERCGAVIR